MLTQTVTFDGEKVYQTLSPIHCKKWAVIPLEVAPTVSWVLGLLGHRFDNLEEGELSRWNWPWSSTAGFLPPNRAGQTAADCSSYYRGSLDHYFRRDGKCHSVYKIKRRFGGGYLVDCPKELREKDAPVAWVHGSEHSAGCPEADGTKTSRRRSRKAAAA